MVLIMVKNLYLHNLALNMVILLPILGVNFDNKLGTDVLFEVLDAKVDRQRQLLQEPKILHQVQQDRHNSFNNLSATKYERSL